MKDFLNNHFNALLLAGMVVFFSAVAIWTVRHAAPDDAFKWAAGLAGAAMGALLMLMRPQENARDVAPSSPPKPPAPPPTAPAA
jgi:hypothetical protein